ncbi:MAG: spondin domain-containing protein [Mangrovicoccus sp.]
MRPHLFPAVSALAFSLLALPASALTLQITVENLAPQGGVSFTPLWAAFHNGSFDSFDVGSISSAPLEALAELGQTAGLDSLLSVTDPNSVSAAIPAAQNGIGPVDPGETTSIEFNVDPTDARYFSYLAMILPSNDTFIGNDDALAYEIFDAKGAFNGTQIIEVLNAYDAGTEVNDPNLGPAFVVGQDATAGATENGVVSGASSFDSFLGVQTPLGSFNSLAGLDGTQPIARITIEAVAPVPLPAGLALGVTGLAALGAVKTARRNRA